LPEGVAEVVVGFFFVGVNAVVEGEEAEFGGVGGGFFGLVPQIETTS
jgi:hypothetical protein